MARYQDAQCGVLGRRELLQPGKGQAGAASGEVGGQKQWLKSQQAPFPPLLPHVWVHAGSGEDSTRVSLSTLVQAQSVGGKRRERLLLRSLP